MKSIKLLFLLLFIKSTMIAQSHEILICEDWKEDLEYLSQKIEERHADAFHSVNKTDFNTSVDGLKKRLCELDEKHRIIAFSELVAKINDAHTWIDFRYLEKWKYHQLPFQLEVFNDGVFIIDAIKEYRKFIGHKVVEINDFPIDTIANQVSKIGYRENEYTKLLSIARFLPISEVLSYYNIAGKNHKISVKTNYKGNNYITQFSPVQFDSLDFSGDSNLIEKDLPLYRNKTNEIFWTQYFPTDKLLYIQINAFREDESHNFRILSDTLSRLIDNEDFDKLIVDLRSNFGGNSKLSLPLIYPLMKFEKKNEKGKIFLITARKTLSASVVFVDETKKFANPIIVGEPTGAKPNLYGENSYMLTLPNSKIKVSYSSEYFQAAGPFVNADFISPDLYVPLNSNDFFENEDPILESIKNFKDLDTLSIERMKQACLNQDFEKAEKIYNNFKNKSQNKFRDTERLVRLLADELAENNLEMAEKIYKLNFKDYPDRILSYINLAIAYEENKNTLKAIKYYRIALDKIKVDHFTNKYLQHYIEDYAIDKLNDLNK